MLREVTYLPSLPAKGELLTMNIMDTVGSSILTNGSGSMQSGAQTVSPMFRLVRPATAMMSPSWA